MMDKKILNNMDSVLEEKKTANYAKYSPLVTGW